MRSMSLLFLVDAVIFLAAADEQSHVEPFFGHDSSWCSSNAPARPQFPAKQLKWYDDGWIPLIEDRVACNTSQLKQYGISCEDHASRRVYKFPAACFKLTQQVWLPPHVEIEGVSDPNMPGNARQRKALTTQTLFFSTDPGCSGKLTASKSPWPIPQVHDPVSSNGPMVPIKCVRKGFLMNDDTVVRNVHGQGLAEEGFGFDAGRVGADAGLNGGAFFELPGCITTYAVDGTCGRAADPWNHGEGGDHGKHFVTGSGKGVANVLIENVRLNDMLDVSMDKFMPKHTKASWVGFWSAMTPSGEPHQNISFRKVVALRTGRDGINVHGNVINWTGEDLHFENTGDDVFAVWGAGGGKNVQQTGFYKQQQPYAACMMNNPPATDIIFRRIFAKGISAWSSCAHTFGAGKVVYDQMMCCDNNGYPALNIDKTFCPSYPHANVSLSNLAWHDFQGQSLCQNGPSPLQQSVGLECNDPPGKCGSSSWHCWKPQPRSLTSQLLQQFQVFKAKPTGWPHTSTVAGVLVAGYVGMSVLALSTRCWRPCAFRAALGSQNWPEVHEPLAVE